MQPSLCCHSTAVTYYCDYLRPIANLYKIEPNPIFASRDANCSQFSPSDCLFTCWHGQESMSTMLPSTWRQLSSSLSLAEELLPLQVAVCNSQGRCVDFATSPSRKFSPINAAKATSAPRFLVHYFVKTPHAAVLQRKFAQRSPRKSMRM